MDTEWTPSACQLLQILRCDGDFDLSKRKDTVDVEELIVWGDKGADSFQALSGNLKRLS